MKLLKVLSCGLLFLFSGCKKEIDELIKDYPKDNIGEEILEEIIEHYTGIDIDLTPGSEE